MFAVALDGPSGAGKSSIAKAAAKELGFVYVDTGALYRTIGLYLLEHGLDPKDPAQVEPALPEIQVELRHDPEGQKMFLCGREVTGLIRTPEVSMAASRCSAHPAVRAFLLEMQREMARSHDVIMDGRDIGTVVFPEAEFKFYITATAEERASRRYKELIAKGEDVTYEKVLADIKQRDYNDSTREINPLKKEDDALELDTTEMGIEEVIDFISKEMNK